MICQDRRATNLLQLLALPENSERFSIISVIIFKVNTVSEVKQVYDCKYKNLLIPFKQINIRSIMFDKFLPHLHKRVKS